MDAFRYYLVGVDLLHNNDYDKAIGEFEKAVEIDPEFNKAYYKMAIAQWWSEDEGSESGQKSINSILEHERFSSERERTMALGALALMEKRYSEATQLYEQLTDQYHDDKEAWYGLGEALYHYGEQTRENALEAFENAIDLDVGFVLAYRHVFDLYFQYGRYDRAFEKANNLIDVKPESLMGYRYLAKAAVFQGDSTQIERSIARALKHHTDPDELQGLYYDLFLAYARTGSLQKANEFARRTIEAAPQTRDTYRVQIWGDLIRLTALDDQPDKTDSLIDVALASDIAMDHKFHLISNLVMWSVAAQIALYDRLYDQAEEYSLEAIKLSEEGLNDWASNVLYDSYLYRRDYSGALEFAFERVDKYPELTSSYIQVIQIYIYSGRFNKADSILQTALGKMETALKKVMLLRNAAYAYRMTRNYDKALGHFQQALKIDSSQLELHSGAGRTYVLRGQYEEAERSFRKILKENQADVSSMNSLAEIMIRRGDYGGAEQQLQEALTIDSTNASVLRMFGYLYSTQGQYDKATGFARQAVGKSGSFFSFNLLAWLMVAGELDVDSGITIGKTVLDNPPTGNPFDIYIHESPFVPLPDHTLGLGYLKLGQYEKALNHLEKAAELRPDDNKISKDLADCRNRLGG
jgi:tetratricopeptide (TPR) repeat protein